MTNMLQLMLDWAEVWGPLLPLSVLLTRRRQPVFLRPVIVYLCFAFVIDLVGNIIADYKDDFPPKLQWIKDNLILYNIHSIVRALCFGYFFVLLKQKHYRKLKMVLTTAATIFIIINFSYFEPFHDPNHLSGNLLATEAYLLLIFCMLYYLSILRDDIEVLSGAKDFWIVTGLSVYVVINFFVFLFYVPMIAEEIAEDMWSIHNGAYIILCIFIAKAFYVPNITKR